MCNCNSSFCAVCCRRVKAYRFDNVPEITGDLQLYTEFYKVGEAYGHWKFTIDDLEAYLDIPTVLWSDKLVAFGHTATGGLFYQSNFKYDYTTSSLTVGTRGVGTEGLYSVSIGNGNILSSSIIFNIGTSNTSDATSGNLFILGDSNTLIGTTSSFVLGESNTMTNGTLNFASGFGNTLTGQYNTLIGNSLDDGGFVGVTMLSDSIGFGTSIANDAFTGQFAGGYRFRLDAASTAVNISSTGIVAIDNVVNNNAEDQLLVWNSTTKEVEYRDVSSLPGGGGGSGTVTSVDAAFLNGTALTVVGGAITTAGTFDFEWQGLNTDYVAGDGSIIAFPTLTSGTVTSVSAGNGMTFTTITTSGAVTLGTPSSITLASTNSVGVGTHSHLFAPGGTTAQYIRGDGTLATTPLGSVTSVGMTITGSTALSVAGSPITTSGTFAVTWTGSNTQYVAGDGSLITFPTLTSGTVTAVNSGAGMDFANFTTSGTIILGAGSDITLASTNSVSGTTHAHKLDLGGSAGQYLAGDTTLQTFPTIPVALWADKRLAFGQTAAGGLTYDSYIKYDYSTYSFTIGTRSAGTEGLYSAVIGITNLNSDNYTLQIGNDLSNTSGAGNLNVGNDNVLTSAFFSSVIGNHIDYSGSNSIIGGSLQNVVGSNNNISGSSHTVAGGNNLVSGIEHTVNGSAITALGYYTNITHDGVTVLSDLNYTGVTSSTATNQFIARFLNGYVFKLTASSTAVAINSSGQIVANFVPSSPSSTDIIVRDGGNILSYRTVASLPFTNNTGTVTNFSANDLTTFTDPLFTVNVTNPTTIPDLTFTLPTLTQKLVFAAPWGVSGQPFWRQLLPSDLQADGASTGQVIAWNGTAWVPSAASGGYWSRSGTVLYTTTSADAVVINTATSNSALARLNVGELGYTAANYQSNIGLHQTDTYGIDKGVSISGYPQAGGSYLGVGKIGFYKENATLNNQDTYFSISTRTGASNVTVDSTKFKISGAGLVTITNIPSSSSSVNLVVSNSGTLESRTIASLAYYTGGTGISISGSVITNTLPSKWQIIGALYLTPAVSAYDIATPITGSIGYVTMTKGTASQCGYFEVRTAAAARVGYIGYQTGYMNYSSDIGNHRFNGGTVQINNIPSGSTSLNILTTNGGVVETRTIASLIGLPSSVWYLQGGTTASTNTSQNIYRTGDVWLNTGSTGAGGYKFRVTGDSYFEAQQYFAYATYQVWRNSANNAWLNGIRYNTSNQLELGQSSFDIYLPGYTSSRSVDTKTLLDKTLFVNSSGVVKSESSEWVRNDGASCWITSTESHLADNTNRRVTFDSSTSVFNTYYTFGYSSGDYKMFFPGSFSQHLVICTLEYTTSGTPTVTATLRKTSTVVETNISTSADGRKVMTIHAIMSGTSSDYPTLYIYNASGGAAITLQKCKITMIPLGENPP